MALPRWVALLNRRYTNRFLEPLARLSSGFAIVHHIGRRSGASYETPVNIFWLGDDAIIALTYGPDSDWVQNSLDGPAAVTWAGSTRVVERCAVVGRAVAWPALPQIVRAALRILHVHHFCRLSLQDPISSQ